METIGYWNKTRHIDQWNKTREPRNKSIHMCQLICSKGARQYSGERTVSWINVVGETGQPHAKKETALYPPYTKINTKWMKNLTVRPETIKVIGKKTDSKLLDASWRQLF